MKNTARPVWSKKLSLAGSTLVLGAGIGAGSAAMAAESFSPHAYALEEVPSFSAYGGFRSFDALDRKTLIVWTSPFRPFLIELAAPSVDLRFARAIGIKSRPGRVYSGFDSVIIDGRSYPISRIYKLSRDEAKAIEEEAAAKRDEKV